MNQFQGNLQHIFNFNRYWNSLFGLIFRLIMTKPKWWFFLFPMCLIKFGFVWREQGSTDKVIHLQLLKELEGRTWTVISASGKECKRLTGDRIPQYELRKAHNPQLSKRAITLKCSGEGTDHSLRPHWQLKWLSQQCPQLFLKMVLTTSLSLCRVNLQLARVRLSSKLF